MSVKDNRLKELLFDYETTYKTNYRRTDLRNVRVPTKEKKPSALAIRPPPLKDTHTLSNWKWSPVSFKLHHRLKDIIHTNPMVTQKPYSMIIPSSDAVRKTRPRLVMTPAVSMDDIDDPVARAILCNSMYMSEMQKSSREAVSSVAPYFSVKAPLPDHYAPSNPVAPIDHKREEVQRTRPRLVITPAVKLDDTDREVYKLVTEDIYKSTYMEQTKEQADRLAAKSKIIAPLPSKMTPSNPLYLPIAQHPYVSPEWRMSSITLDRDAAREAENSTRVFWLRRKPQMCDEDKADKYIFHELRDPSSIIQAIHKDNTKPSGTKYKIKIKKPEARRPSKRPSPFLLKDTAIISGRKLHIPFDLFWKTKGIIQDDPRVPQEPHAPLDDPEREEVQKTRPRVVLTPASKIDDLKEPSRQVLVKDMYTTTYMQLMREPVERAARNFHVQAPLPEHPAPSVPVCQITPEKRYVPTEWRGDQTSWDHTAHRRSVKRSWSPPVQWRPHPPPYADLFEPHKS